MQDEKYPDLMKASLHEVDEARQARNVNNSDAVSSNAEPVQQARGAVERTCENLACFAREFRLEKGRAPRVLVGISGGVDSSVAAALLVEAGWNVTGAYMKNWTMDVPGMRCPWADDLADAKRVAVKLGIDFLVFDFQDAYKRDVVDYLVEEYKAGRTPNPDVMCNQQVKFGLFLQEAQAQGFDFIATGHYAQTSLVKGEQGFLSGDIKLLCARDKAKDQTYFLYRMSPTAISKTIFPLGDLTKPEVRQAAQDRGFTTAGKPDSQGICFVGEAGIRDFLSMYITAQPGALIDIDSQEVIGHHDGALFYTIGQRRGLGIGGGDPYHVVQKDMEANIVYVRKGTRERAQRCKTLVLTNVTSTTDEPIADGSYRVRTHHGGAQVPVSVHIGAVACRSVESIASNMSEGAVLTFESEQPVVAPGQSAVLYKGEVCVGGGIVAE